MRRTVLDGERESVAAEVFYFSGDAVASLDGKVKGLDSVGKDFKPGRVLVLTMAAVGFGTDLLDGRAAIAVDADPDSGVSAALIASQVWNNPGGADV